MFRFHKKLSLVAALIGAAILSAPSQAEAAFQLRFSTTGTGGPFTTITDNVGLDTNLTAGVIAVNVGALSIVGTSSSFISPTLTLLDLQVSGIAAAGTYDLVIDTTVDGINTEPPPQLLHFAYNGSITPPGSGLSVSMQTWVDDLNALFGISGLGIVANTGAKVVPPNVSGDIVFSASPDYSATARVHITGTSLLPASLSLDNNNSIVPTPAPAGLLLVLSGMPALGFGAWLRRRRRQAVA